MGTWKLSIAKKKIVFISFKLRESLKCYAYELRRISILLH